MIDLKKEIDDFVDSDASLKEALEIFEIGESEYNKAIASFLEIEKKTISNSNDAYIS